MILIAPDKYRSTMDAYTAARIIARSLPVDIPMRILPLSDGGEGTAAIIGSDSGWQHLDGFYFNPITRTAAIDSAQTLGYVALGKTPVQYRTSAPLALKLNEVMAQYRPVTILLGVGGTAVCDGGKGFLDALDKCYDWGRILQGLVDVQVPLLGDGNAMSALSFARQKGYRDMNRLRHRLEEVAREYGAPVSDYDGAGGGLGYALATVLGCRCHAGAQWMVAHSGIDWPNLSMVITGEGCMDRQSLCGKLTGTLYNEADRYRVPVLAFAGKVEKGVDFPFEVVDVSRFDDGSPLTPQTAMERLKIAVSKSKDAVERLLKKQ